jgi:hypothetical protein
MWRVRPDLGVLPEVWERRRGVLVREPQLLHSWLGEIVQPYPTRNSVLHASTNLDVGGGTLVLADAGGNYVANAASADPTTLYLYVFYRPRRVQNVQRKTRSRHCRCWMKNHCRALVPVLAPTDAFMATLSPVGSLLTSWELDPTEDKA